MQQQLILVVRASNFEQFLQAWIRQVLIVLQVVDLLDGTGWHLMDMTLHSLN